MDLLPISPHYTKEQKRQIEELNWHREMITKLEHIVDAARELCEAASPITYSSEELARIPQEQMVDAWQRLHELLETVKTTKQIRTPMSKADRREMFETAHALYKEKYPDDPRPMEEVFKGMFDLDSGYPEA